MKPIALLFLLSVLSLSFALKANDETCGREWECESNCCTMAYDDQNVLGYYCRKSDFCGKENLGLGQSCTGPSECSTNCCESTVCQSKTYCFEKYILPFIVIFVIVGLFILAAIFVFVLYWIKAKRAEKMRKRVIHEQDDEEYTKKPGNETTAMGLKGETMVEQERDEQSRR